MALIDQQPFMEYDRLIKQDPLLNEIRHSATHMRIAIKGVGGTMNLVNLKEGGIKQEYHSEFASSVVINLSLKGHRPLLSRPDATSDLWHTITEVFQHHFTDYPSSVTIKRKPDELEITIRPPINAHGLNIPMYSTARYLFPGGGAEIALLDSKPTKEKGTKRTLGPLASEAPFKRELQGFLESLGFDRQDIERCMEDDRLKMIPPPSFLTIGDQINDELNYWRGLKTGETQEARMNLMKKIFTHDAVAFEGVSDVHPDQVKAFLKEHNGDKPFLNDVYNILREHREDITKIKAADFILLKLEVLLKAINMQHAKHGGRLQIIDKITEALGVHHTNIMRDISSGELLVTVPETDTKKQVVSSDKYVRLIDVLLEMNDLSAVKKKLQPISLAVYMGQINPDGPRTSGHGRGGTSGNV